VRRREVTPRKCSFLHICGERYEERVSGGGQWTSRIDGGGIIESREVPESRGWVKAKKNGEKHGGAGGIYAVLSPVA